MAILIETKIIIDSTSSYLPGAEFFFAADIDHWESD